MKSKKLNTKFQNLNSNHGITLIALIITIVVMLILVAVTLSIALGENGVVSNAKKAAKDTNSAMANDANIANDVTYGDVQGINNIVEHLTNPREKVLAEDLEEGDNIKVVLKNVELNEELKGGDGIFKLFDNNSNMTLAIAPAGSISDKVAIQLVYMDENYSQGVISEDKPMYLYLTNGSTFLPKR